jgi:hypothetical protein
VWRECVVNTAALIPAQSDVNEGFDRAFVPEGAEMAQTEERVDTRSIELQRIRNHRRYENADAGSEFVREFCPFSKCRQGSRHGRKQNSHGERGSLSAIADAFASNS